MKKFRRIFYYLKDYKFKIVLYFISTILATLFSVFSLALLAPFLSIIFNTGDANTSKSMLSGKAVLKVVSDFISQSMDQHGKMYAISLVCIFIVVAILLKSIFTYLCSYISAPIRSAIVTRIRDDLFGKILRLPVGYFTEQKKGDLISRMTNDVQEVENSIVSTMEGLIRDPFTVIGFLFYLAYTSPQLSLFLVILLPLTAVIIGRVSKSLKRQSQDASEKLGVALSVMDEALSGIRVVKAFLAENILFRRFVRTNNEVYVLRKSMNARRDLASPLTEVLGVAVLCVILFFGGRLVLVNKVLNAGDLIVYISIFALMINPAKSLSTSISNIKRGEAALERIDEIMDTPVLVADKGTRELPAFEQSIEFKNVSFGYGEHSILKNINLVIPKGKTVALVGSSGAGKSTLADLIPRFHDATSGEILIDGINIMDYKIASLRSRIGIVTQEPILFNDTIANNIALGTPDATPAQIEEAAKVANAYHFIQQKEGGFEANIGERGAKLSGGERQRMTIARAILKNPAILILDEATSSLDTESEKLVQNAIDNMMQNRTVLVIAHRLSTIRNADEIIVLQHGEIIERGTHEELMLHAEGQYRKLVRMQDGK